VSLKELEKEHGLTQEILLGVMTMQEAARSEAALVYSWLCLIIVLSTAALVRAISGVNPSWIFWFAVLAIIFCVVVLTFGSLKSDKRMKKQLDKVVALDKKLDGELKYRDIPVKKIGKRRSGGKLNSF